jgi:hypothetical protein
MIPIQDRNRVSAHVASIPIDFGSSPAPAAPSPRTIRLDAHRQAGREQGAEDAALGDREVPPDKRLAGKIAERAAARGSFSVDGIGAPHCMQKRFPFGSCAWQLGHSMPHHTPTACAAMGDGNVWASSNGGTMTRTQRSGSFTGPPRVSSFEIRSCVDRFIASPVPLPVS